MSQIKRIRDKLGVSHRTAEIIKQLKITKQPLPHQMSDGLFYPIWRIISDTNDRSWDQMTLYQILWGVYATNAQEEIKRNAKYVVECIYTAFKVEKLRRQ